MPRTLCVTCALIAAMACGTARVLQRTPRGGVIELQGDHGKAMEQANEEMAAQCGADNVTIMQEGEEVVGKDRKNRDKMGWRLRYQCGIVPVGSDGALPASDSPAQP